jgi:hypothetical protein
MKGLETTRRGVLAKATGAGLALSSMSPSFAGAQGRGGVGLDPADPAQALEAMIKMRGALDEQLVISCIACRYHGVVNARMTPFYNLVAATFARYRRAPSGEYDGVSFEIEYFIDPATGGVLDQWKNPYTGEVVQAHHTDSKPVKFRIGLDSQLQLAPAPLYKGSVIAHQTLPLQIIGNDVWSTEVTTASVPTDGGKPILFNETITNHASLSDLRTPGLMRVKTDARYIGVSSFRPWQAMGDQPGEMIGFGEGCVGIGLDELPARWRAITKTRHPEALVDPGSYLDPLWKTL